jgi:hypothetical protein
MSTGANHGAVARECLRTGQGRLLGIARPTDIEPERSEHGFQTLEGGTVFSYKCTAPYSPADEHSLRWHDPPLGIEWPIADAIISGKDRCARYFEEVSERHGFGRMRSSIAV